MTFTVGVAKSLQAIAYVKREGVFHAWWLADECRGDNPIERLEFGINLATLLEWCAARTPWARPADLMWRVHHACDGSPASGLPLVCLWSASCLPLVYSLARLLPCTACASLAGRR